MSKREKNYNYLIILKQYFRIDAANIYLGFTNTRDPITGGRQRISVTTKDIIPHENYNRINFANDIALIHLPAAAKFSGNND